MRERLLCVIAAVVGLGACKDIDRFSTAPDESYCGRIVSASIVRLSFPSEMCMRLTFDASRVNERPGSLWTNDGMFANTPLQPIRIIRNTTQYWTRSILLAGSKKIF